MLVVGSSFRVLALAYFRRLPLVCGVSGGTDGREFVTYTVNADLLLPSPSFAMAAVVAAARERRQGTRYFVE